MNPQRKGLYKRLAPTSIRLFRLNPQPTDISVGTLEQVRLDEAPPYYALSHSWGQETAGSDIVLGRNKLSLCNDLAVGIHRLRMIAADPESCEPPLDYIWIDNICINLDDPKERSEQVQLMCNIYSKAVKTLVWLGPAFTSSFEAWDLVGNIYSIFRAHHPTSQSIDDVAGHIYSDEYHAKCGLPSWNQSVWSSFRTLLELRWFSRIWVVQEVALSALDPVIIHGEHVRSWESLAWCASWLRRKGYARHPQIPQQILNIDAIRLLRQSTVRWPLDALMSITQIKFHATDQRDKVYSLFGLASECEDLLQTPEGLKPDYTITAEQAYCRGVLPEKLDYTNCQPCQRGVLIGVISANTPARLGFPANYNACSGRRAKLHKSSDDSTLQLDGARVDTIQRAVCYNATCVSKEEFAEGFASTLARILQAAMLLLTPQNVTEWLNNFIRTTTADQHRLHGRLWDQTVADGSRYLLDLIQEISDPQPFSIVTAQLVDALNSTSLGGIPAEYAALARNFGFNRSFIITEDGRMGLGPSDSRPGDDVTVLFGGEVLYILRPTGEHFSFVGESYIEGLMDGQAIDLCQKERAQIESISLR
ncbi:het-6-heterokaryon incompatibility [Fusarium napiforme]|uniref:Het-6-heterokaryon incompatibility n=1 Tax=Fusarium napiforme TaxID=42672 RepID=A0A8H5NJI0_9HYPO|nr:het-6-heterokaryon incompatibility [Fusarium napiforme]